VTLASKASVIACFVAILCAVSPVAAAAEVFFVFGTFDDGGTVSGWFELDLSTGTIGFYSIGTTSGQSLPGNVYTDSSSGAQASVYLGCSGDGYLGFIFTGPEFFAPNASFVFRLQFVVPGYSVATFAGGQIVPNCGVGGFTSWETQTGDGSVQVRNLENDSGNDPSSGNVIGTTGGAGAASAALRLAVSVNQSTFAVGQVLRTSASVDDPGLRGAADLYLGVVLPDRVTVVFWTGGSITAVGRLHDVRTYRPYATGVPLGPPFVTNLPNFFSRQWTGNEPRGSYVLFNVATKAGALSRGVTHGDFLGIATAPFVFP
jgi:hypothetical protein